MSDRTLYLVKYINQISCKEVESYVVADSISQLEDEISDITQIRTMIDPSLMVLPPSREAEA